MDSYEYIKNPNTNRKVSIHTRLGKQILKKYAQSGGVAKTQKAAVHAPFIG